MYSFRAYPVHGIRNARGFTSLFVNIIYFQLIVLLSLTIFSRKMTSIQKVKNKEEVEKYYTIGETLGRFADFFNLVTLSGTFSTVKKGTNKKTNEQVAIKIIDKKAVGEKTEMLQTEIDILRKVRHQYVITLKEMFESPTHIFLIMELSEAQ